MSYMNCPRCGLSVRLRADQLAWGHCPQCLGRAGITVPIYIADRYTPGSARGSESTVSVGRGIGGSGSWTNA